MFGQIAFIIAIIIILFILSGKTVSQVMSAMSFTNSPDYISIPMVTPDFTLNQENNEPNLTAINMQSNYFIKDTAGIEICSYDYNHADTDCVIEDDVWNLLKGPNSQE
jgi:hypothetical protein